MSLCVIAEAGASLGSQTKGSRGEASIKGEPLFWKHCKIYQESAFILFFIAQRTTSSSNVFGYSIYMFPKQDLSKESSPFFTILVCLSD